MTRLFCMVLVSTCNKVVSFVQNSKIKLNFNFYNLYVLIKNQKTTKMARETKKTLIAQIHQKHYTFGGKSFRPNKSYVKWCSDNNATLALSRLNITELINRRDAVGWSYDEKCTSCGRYECDDWEECLVKHRKPVIISDNICTNCDCIITDTDEVGLCKECWENVGQNTCVCGDIKCDGADDWDKTPRDYAPKVPELPSWIVEESRRLKQKALMAQMLALDVKMMELDALFQKC